MTAPVDVVVVGAGIIGLASAWRLAQHGASVAVVDPAPGSGASHVAAGMLAPVTEVHYGEEALLALNLHAAARWPPFAVELEEATGCSVGYREGGTLVVALGDDDLRSIEKLRRFQDCLGLGVTRLRSGECRAREPWLSPRVRGGVLAEDDHQVDPRLTVQALLVAAQRAGATFVADRATRLAVDRDRAVGVETRDGRIGSAAVVLTAGCWSGSIGGVPPDVVPPVRPVKGQILRLRFDPQVPPLGATVRGVADGRSVYLVPRLGGELVVGATVEEMGYDTTITAGAVHDLLRAAIDLVPGVAELELAEALAGLRPATPDNGPVIGPTAVDGLVVASGHHRNGVLLAPLTADAVAGVVTGDGLPPVVVPFDARRFR